MVAANNGGLIFWDRVCWFLFFFFFSSRRRHTRCSRDWSSDVCSSDLYDVTAISFHAYAYIQAHYALLPSGGSVGDGYGPMIVSTRAYSQDEIKRKRIADRKSVV